MATTALSGHGGSVTGLGTVEVREWSAELTHRLLDGTSMASAGYEEFVTGLRGGTFSVELIQATYPTVQTYTGTIGAAFAVTLNAGGTGTLKLSGNALVESVSPAVPVGDTLKYTVKAKFTGAITVGTVT